MTHVPALLWPLLALAAVGLPVLIGVLPARVLIAAYAFVLPFGSDLVLPFGPDPYNTVSTLVGVLVTFGLAVRLVLDRRAARVPHPSVPLWLLLVSWLGLTLLWSVDPGRSVSTLAILGSLVVLYLLAAVLPLDRRALLLIELAAVAGGLVVAAQAMLTAATGRLEETTSRLPRFTYDEGDPNITAASLLLPLALCMWWSLRGSGLLRRAGASVASIALVLTIALTGSRGGLVAAFCVLAVAITAGRRVPVLRTGSYLLLAVMAFGLTVLAVPAGLRDHLTETESTGRTQIWQVGLHACVDVCDTGSGYGTFGAVYRETYLTQLSLEGNGDREYAAHNVALSTLVEGGVTGLVLLVAALGVLVLGLLRLPADRRGPPLAAVAGLVVSNMFVSNLGFKYFWLTLTYATLALTVGRSAAGPARG